MREYFWNVIIWVLSLHRPDRSGTGYYNSSHRARIGRAGQPRFWASPSFIAMHWFYCINRDKSIRLNVWTKTLSSGINTCSIPSCGSKTGLTELRLYCVRHTGFWSKMCYQNIQNSAYPPEGLTDCEKRTLRREDTSSTHRWREYKRASDWIAISLPWNVAVGYPGVSVNNLK